MRNASLDGDGSLVVDPKYSRWVGDVYLAAENEIGPEVLSRYSNVVRSVDGDLSTGIEAEYANRFGRFLEKEGIPTIILSEGLGVINDYRSETEESILATIDPDEGSTNLASGILPHGVNLTGHYINPSGDTLHKHWITAAIKDRHNNFTYLAIRGEEGDEVVVIGPDGKERHPNKKAGTIIEFPIAYILEGDEAAFYTQIARYGVVRREFKNNQYRDVSATGLGVDVVDGAKRMFLEGRGLKKLMGPWNTTAAGIIVNAGGGKATYADGRSLDDAVIWNEEKWREETGGWNPDHGNELFACQSPEDHAKAVMLFEDLRREGVGVHVIRKLLDAFPYLHSVRAQINEALDTVDPSIND
ncbi:MAG: hypothetical protein ABIH52_00145 [Candidatus Aenigmatarchaeota archaeon]|nr:hypothetical protein [Nanoarchaeota archaeon]